MWEGEQEFVCIYWLSSFPCSPMASENYSEKNFYMGKLLALAAMFIFIYLKLCIVFLFLKKIQNCLQYLLQSSNYIFLKTAEKSKRQNTHSLTALKTFKNMGILTCQKVESLGRDHRFSESELCFFFETVQLTISTLNWTQKQTGRWSWFMTFGWQPQLTKDCTLCKLLF